MSNINDEMKATADYAISSSKEKFGQELDLSDHSIGKLEKLLEQAYQSLSGRAKDEKTSKAILQTANVWGSYLGEFLRQKWGGAWIQKDSERVISIQGFEFSPIGFVHQKITNHPEHSLNNYLVEVERKISPSQGIPPRPQELSSDINSKRKCPYCAEEVMQDAVLCRYCGRKLSSNPGKDRKFWIAVGIFVSGAILLLCGLTYNSYNKYQAQVAYQTTQVAYQATLAYQKQCGEAEFVQSLNEINNILYQWSIQKNVADYSTGWDIVTPYMKMKEIRDTTATMRVAPCLEDAHNKLLQYMDAVNLWIKAFINKDYDYLVAHLKDGEIALAKFNEALEQANQCEPICR